MRVLAAWKWSRAADDLSSCMTTSCEKGRPVPHWQKSVIPVDFNLCSVTCQPWPNKGLQVTEASKFQLLRHGSSFDCALSQLMLTASIYHSSQLYKAAKP